MWQKFHVVTPFAFWDMGFWDAWNVCLQTYTNNGIH